MPIYRNGTYIAFHAQGTNIPIDSDIKYYNLLKAWSAKKDDDFTFVNSHEKTSALRASSSKETLKSRLSERLRNYSKNMLLIIGDSTRFDRDWVPFEIEYAVDSCNIPLIIAYPDFDAITVPNALRELWPTSLRERIDAGTVRAIHIPFKKAPIMDALNRFNLTSQPGGPLVHYTFEAYKNWGLV